MSQEKLLASLCAACELPPPLYDLEVTGGDKVTVCCVVGRSGVSLIFILSLNIVVSLWQYLMSRVHRVE